MSIANVFVVQFNYVIYIQKLAQQLKHANAILYIDIDYT